MATQTAVTKPEAAVPAPKRGLVQLLEAYKHEIARALPRHMTPERMIRVAITAYKKSTDLQKCDVNTIMSAIIQASQLGLEPDGVLGHAYLVPFNNKIKEKVGGVVKERWEKQCQLIVGYRGFVELTRRSGMVSSIQAHAVYRNDQFNFAYGLQDSLAHVPHMGKGRGEIVCFYAIAKLKDGGYHFEVMSKDEVDQVRSSSKAKDSGPWVDHYAEMGKKTVIRRLVKLLPLAPEIQRVAAADEQREVGIDASYVMDVEAEPIEDLSAGSISVDDLAPSDEPNRGHDNAAPPPELDAPISDEESLRLNQLAVEEEKESLLREVQAGKVRSGSFSFGVGKGGK